MRGRSDEGQGHGRGRAGLLPETFRRWLADELRSREERHLLRRAEAVAPGPPGRIVRSGRTYLNLASNDYLGLSRHPRVVEAASQAAGRWGVGAGASRLVTGTTALHEALEERVARYLGAESALVFPTGFQTNIGTIVGLTDAEALVLSDEMNHASIVDGCRLSRARRVVFPHGDVGAVERTLARHPGTRALVVSDSIFSTTGAVAPVEALARTCGHRGALLLLDEAHAFGVYGPRGRGVASAAGVDGLVRVATFSKAMGAAGGVVVGPRLVRDVLVNRARSFIFTTGLSPVVAAAALAAVEIADSDEGEEARRRLWRNVRRLGQGLEEQRWPCWRESHIVSVLLGEARDALSASQALRDAGLWAIAFRPPTVPEGMSLLRLAVTAAHSEEDVARVLEAFSNLKASAPSLWERAQRVAERLPRPPGRRQGAPEEDAPVGSG